jgi:hypothetical protein
MEPERRGRVIEPPSNANPQGEERARTAKPFDIPKRLVWNAWRLVRANAGAAGVDEESIELFERDLANNLYRIWNRLSSGSYFPPPVKEVLIPKKAGGQRPLGIPTVSDRIAQAVVKLGSNPNWNLTSMRTLTGTDRGSRPIKRSQLPANVAGGTIGCWSSTSGGCSTTLTTDF